MPRKGAVPKRDVLPDPVYHSKTVTKFINKVMLSGKKSVAERVVYDAFETIRAKTGKDPAQLYHALEYRYGAPIYRRIDSPMTPEMKAAFKSVSPESVTMKELAGDPVQEVLTKAPGNGAPFGGLKVVTGPSGTEPIYKLYMEGFKGEAHFEKMRDEAQAFLAGMAQA